MKFTERLYQETKESHTEVDRHIFVNLIRKNDIAAKLYIDLNKICIYELQKTLDLKDKQLQQDLFRDIDQPDMFINEPLNELLILCKEYPLEAEYMFKAGLIMGGNLLKKYVNIEDHNFLTFKNPKQLFKELKDYLDQYVQDHDLFIKNVNNIYKQIKKCFDKFAVKCN
jgi:hypothetical protein